MKLLLDTHVWLWWLSDHPKLGAAARAIISDQTQQIYISAASIWELSIKEAKGLLRLNDDFDTKLAAESFIPLSITYAHSRKSALLPFLHKDPFDRMLVAQCLLENMTLVTSDLMLEQYNISIIKAV